MRRQILGLQASMIGAVVSCWTWKNWKFWRESIRKEGHLLMCLCATLSKNSRSSGAFTRLPLCAKQMPYGLLT